MVVSFLSRGQQRHVTEGRGFWKFLAGTTCQPCACEDIQGSLSQPSLRNLAGSIWWSPFHDPLDVETKAITWIHTATCGPKSHTQNSHYTSAPLVADCLKALQRVAGLLAQQIQNSSALAEAANISATRWADPRLLLQGLNPFRVCASLGVLPQPLGTVWKFPISYTPLSPLII